MINMSSLSKASALVTAAGLLSAGAVASSFVSLNAARGVSGMAAVCAAGAVFYLLRLRRLVAMIATVSDECSKGNMESRVIFGGEQGDLRLLIKQVNNFIDISDAYVRESRATLEYAAQGKYFRKIMLTGMQGCWRQASQAMNEGMDATRRNVIIAVQKSADRLESTVKKAVDQLASSIGQVQTTAQGLSHIAENSSGQAKTLSLSSEETSQSVNSLAAAVEEFSASIGDINKQVTASSNIVKDAVTSAQSANTTLVELLEKAEKIGSIIELINTIASQINLLALNATIEAARAGEAGKGFAVVASEVKTLATQTAKATAQISESIGSTREGIHKAAAVVQEIGNVVKKIDESSTIIAAAMEEQNVVTKDISRNIQSVAKNTSNISSAVGELSSAAARTGESSHNMNQSAAQLAQESGVLRDEVDTFIKGLKSQQA